MTTRPVLVLFVRALGAFQSGVAAFLLVPPGSKVPALLVAVAAGAGVFWLGWALAFEPSIRAVVGRGYIAPLGVLAVAQLLVAAPPTWAAAGGQLRQFVAAVFAGTPAAAFLGCLAYACLAAGDKKDAGFYR